eukprot:scaffold7242_cov130-Isochrysis_galbana.AAC.4
MAFFALRHCRESSHPMISVERWCSLSHTLNTTAATVSATNHTQEASCQHPRRSTESLSALLIIPTTPKQHIHVTIMAHITADNALHMVCD